MARDPFQDMMRRSMYSSVFGPSATPLTVSPAVDEKGRALAVGDVVEIRHRTDPWIDPGDSREILEIDGRHIVVLDNFGDREHIPAAATVLVRSSQPERKSAPQTQKKQTVSIDSVIMPTEKKTAIRAALSQVENHKKIFDDWGFGETFEKGTAISMLFWGVPGTGKTLMAQAIADQIGGELKLYGAAEIETSEPGGAERNIQKIFKEAEEAQNGSAKRVILFDECDSLLMDRNTVGPIIAATINCLLSEIERYTGVVIFTTNRLGKLDPALERRLSAKIEFEFPDPAAREQIWRRMIPKKAPLEKDVDFTALAETAIAGGNIKNAVLNAARQAVFEGSKKIAQRHFEAAAKTELASRADFQKAAQNNDQTRLTDFSREGRSGITINRSAAQRYSSRGRNGAP